MSHTLIRSLIVGLLLLSVLNAQDDAKAKQKALELKVQRARQSVFGQQRTVTVSILGDLPPDPETAKKQENFQKLMKDLLALHGPGGSGERLECGPIYQALMEDDVGFRGRDWRLFLEKTLQDDPESWGLVYLLEGLGPTVETFLMLQQGNSPEDAAARTKPTFDEVAGADLAWALKLRGQFDGGLRAELLDLYFARCGMAFGHKAAAKQRIEEIVAKTALKDRALTELKRYAQNVLWAGENRHERSTWPNDASERMAFRRLWHALLEADLVIETDGQRAALAVLGKGPGLIPHLLARARGLPCAEVAMPKDDEGGHFLADFFAHEAGSSDAWSKRLDGLKRGKTEQRLEIVDLIFDYGLVAPDLTEPLVDLASQSRDWRLRSMALRALAFQYEAAFDPALKRVGRDKVWQVRLALAEALGSLRSLDAVDELLDLLDDEHIRVRLVAGRSLARLTGVALGSSQKRWKEWIAAKGPDWQLPGRDQARAMQTDAGADERYAKYFDLVIPSNRVVFVLDKSESMYYGLWDGATEQVEGFLKEAGATTFFGLVEYDNDAQVWKKNLMAANAANAKKGISFLTRGKPDGATNIISGLREAFAFKECDSVVLLSDGLPNRGDPSSALGILNAVDAENRYNRVAIHSVQMLTGRSFAHDAKDEDLQAPLSPEEVARRDHLRRQAGSDELGGFLKKLAARNDGNYGLGFGDVRLPPPNSRFRPGTDH